MISHETFQENLSWKLYGAPLLIRNLKIHFILFITTNIKIMVTTQKIPLKFRKMNY